MSQPNEITNYTWADLMDWEGDDRYELIDGIPYLMSPSPMDSHQQAVGDIYRQISNYLLRKQCKVFISPFDVYLFAKKSDDLKKEKTVVQPDVFVVCDPEKMDRRGCKGAPDLAIEVLSPSSQRHDRLTKFNLYEQAGVKEYWIVEPEYKSIQVFVLEDGRYRAVSMAGPEDTLKVNVLDDCVIDLSTVFENLTFSNYDQQG